MTYKEFYGTIDHLYKDCLESTISLPDNTTIKIECTDLGLLEDLKQLIYDFSKNKWKDEIGDREFI